MVAASLFWRSVAIAAAAFFVAAHIPFLTHALEFVALGWAAHWFARQAGSSGTWLQGAGVGAIGGLVGVVATRLVAALLLAAQLGLNPLALGLGAGTLFVAVEGAFFGLVGWWLATRGGRTPWRRWDREG